MIESGEKMKRVVWMPWLLCFVLVISCFFPDWVFAHAYPIKTVPSQESVVQVSPDEIRVKFSEKIDTELSQLTLKDEKGTTVSGQKSGEGDEWLILKIPPLKNGVYNVYWQVLSLDTHVTDGKFRFSVGTELEKQRPAVTPTLGGSAAPQQSKPAEPVQLKQEPLTPVQVPMPSEKTSKPAMKTASKSLVQSNTKPVEPKSAKTEESRQPETSTKEDAAISSSLSKEIQQPAKEEMVEAEAKNEEKSKEPESESDEAAEKGYVPPQGVENHDHQAHHEKNSNLHNHSNWKSFLRIIELITILSVGGIVFYRRIIVRETSSGRSMERLSIVAGAAIVTVTGIIQVLALCDQLGLEWVTVFANTWLGIVSWTRPLLLLGLLLVRKKGMTMLLLVLLSVTFPLTSHAMSGEDAWISIPFHALHFLAAMIWLGGLAGLTIRSYQAEAWENGFHDMHSKMKLFSRYALWMILLESLSGILLTNSRLLSWESLFTTNYGTILLWKILFFLFALMIAGYHRYYLLPRIAKMESNGIEIFQARHLLWGIRLELTLAIIIVVWAGILSTTSPT